MKKNIVISFIFFTLILYSNSISGQQSFESGYIITNQSDTVYGFVKDRKSPPFGKLYSKIRFKESKKQLLSNKYSAYKILEYKQNKRIYESLWIESSGIPFSQNYNSIYGYGEKHFLRRIITGYVNYYQWEFEDSELGNIDVINLFKKENENNLIQVTQGIFGLKKKKLSLYFIDCPELVSKIREKEIKSPADVAIFYNNCKHSNK